jgi:hypothetical protein
MSKKILSELTFQLQLVLKEVVISDEPTNFDLLCLKDKIMIKHHFDTYTVPVTCDVKRSNPSVEKNCYQLKVMIKRPIGIQTFVTRTPEPEISQKLGLGQLSECICRPSIQNPRFFVLRKYKELKSLQIVNKVLIRLFYLI